MVTLAVLAESGLAESHIRKLREELTLKSFLVKATTCNRRRLDDAQSMTHDLTRRATWRDVHRVILHSQMEPTAGWYRAPVPAPF